MRSMKSSPVRYDVKAISGSARAAANAATEMSDFSYRLNDAAPAMANEVDAFLADVRVA